MEPITIVNTIPKIEQAWISKQDAIVYFGYINHRRVFQTLLKEFKNHPDFKGKYKLPTTGVPIVNIVEFEKFLSWREKNKYKRHKK